MIKKITTTITFGLLAASFNAAATSVTNKHFVYKGGNTGISLDNAGNAYVSHTNNPDSNLPYEGSGSGIYRVTPDGQIAVIGENVEGPKDSAMDSQGNLYVCLAAGGVVNKITPADEVIAIDGIQGCDDIAINSQDQAYVVTRNAYDGVQLFIINQNGSNTEVTLPQPLTAFDTMTFDDADTLYLTGYEVGEDHNPGSVYKFTPEGEMSLLSIVPVRSSFSDITYYQGALYVTSTQANQIYRIDMNGRYSVLAGSGLRGSNEGEGLHATFNQPYGIAGVDDENALLVAELGSNIIKKISLAELTDTVDITVDVRVTTLFTSSNERSGHISVDGADNLNLNHGGTWVGNVITGTSISNIARDGTQVTLIEDIEGPIKHAQDSQGNVYMCVPGGQISKMTPAGEISQLDVVARCADIVVNSANEVFVAVMDGEQSYIGVLSASGQIEEYVRLIRPDTYSARPDVMTVDDMDNLYVLGFFYLFKVDPQKQVTLISESNVDFITDMTYMQGALYATREYGNQIVKIALDGQITVFAGSGFYETEQGDRFESAFKSPVGIVGLSDGQTLIVSEAGNPNLRKVLINPPNMPGDGPTGAVGDTEPSGGGGSMGCFLFGFILLAWRRGV
jgi:sugar lactone lactonase YvrE